MLSSNFITVTHTASMNILHNINITIYSVLQTCTLLLELAFCITFCVVVLCANCCITLVSATNLVYLCCAYCEEFVLMET
jgi:hypothetical protein